MAPNSQHNQCTKAGPKVGKTLRLCSETVKQAARMILFDSGRQFTGRTPNGACSRIVFRQKE